MMFYDPDEVSCVDWKKIHSNYKVHKSLNCPECGASVSQFCSGCHKVGYCSKDHQRNHWRKSHKNECCPYKLLKSEEDYGRYLIATKDIYPGEVIFQESPITVGPKQFSAPVCLGCYKSVDGSFKCSSCGWPMCGQKECETDSSHSKKECKVLSACPLKPIINEDDPSKVLPVYECLTPLRCLYVKESRPDNWSVLQSMERHAEIRRQEEIYPFNQNNIVKFIRNHIKYDQVVEDDDINAAIDVLDVNAFEIRSPEFSIRGLYPMTAMMNSVCNPNTQNCIDENYVCRVRAAVRIPKGQEITTSYTLTLSGTAYRRKHLKESKYFDCTCQRCSDPTELHSHFSTLLCRATLKGSSRTCKGFVLPEDPLNDESPWRCSICGETTKSKEIEKFVDDLEDECDRTCSNKSEYELFLKNRLEPVLHPNHRLILDTKFNLMHSYSRERPPDTESEVLLKETLRKKEVIEDILDIITIITPGYFRTRGMLLSERYLAMLFIARSDYESRRNTDKEKYLEELRKAKDVLEESIEILSYEPPETVEWSRYQHSLKAMAQLNKYMTCLG